MVMTKEEIEIKCAEMFKKAGQNLPKTIAIEINGRLKTTLGRCYYQKFGNIVKPIRLEFSKQFLETSTKEDVIGVIAHECAHAVAALETGERQGHNKYFKKICARMGYSDYDGCTNKVERTVSDTELFKYIVTCDCCGSVVGKYHRAGKVVQHPDWYGCKCGGKLIVTQNF